MQLHNPVRGLNRKVLIVLIVGSVVLFHVVALWALHSGLLRPIGKVVVAVRVLEVTAPPPPLQPLPAPQLASEPLAPPTQRSPDRMTKPRAKPAEPARVAAPKPQALELPSPMPDVPAGVATPAPTTSPIGPIAVSEAPLAAPAVPTPQPAKIELPSSNASYLNNPAPVYPAISKRLGEQGKVLVRVLIGADGSPRQAELKRSSGFERLDRSALEYVMNCRYVPGKVAGIPQETWYEAPVNFVLE